MTATAVALAVTDTTWIVTAAAVDTNRSNIEQAPETPTMVCQRNLAVEKTRIWIVTVALATLRF